MGSIDGRMAITSQVAVAEVIRINQYDVWCLRRHTRGRDPTKQRSNHGNAGKAEIGVAGSSLHGHKLQIV